MSNYRQIHRMAEMDMVHLPITYGINIVSLITLKKQKEHHRMVRRKEEFKSQLEEHTFDPGRVLLNLLVPYPHSSKGYADFQLDPLPFV